MSQHNAGSPDGSGGKAKDSSNIDILLRMGFAKDRAEKALLCTGDVSVPAAIDWILSHKDDPLIDVQDQREYLIYLCPSGPLLERINEFLQKTANISGRNGAHLHMPHITMCHAFKTDASNIPLILKIMQEASAAVSKSFLNKIKVDRYSSESFVGLFLDSESEKVLKEYSHFLVTALQRLSSKPIPFNSEKAFHLTLAYHFESSQYEAIHGLSKRIALKTPSQWNFLLLSRDARFHSHDVYRMIRSWSNSASHELNTLPYNENDYVYVPFKQNESLSNGAQKVGWVPAVSWSTGCSGVVPLIDMEKTFASDVWILHGGIPYGSAKIHHFRESGDGTTASFLEWDVCPPAQRFRWIQKGQRQKKELHPAEVSSRKLNKYESEGELPWRKHSVEETIQGSSTSDGRVTSVSTAYVMRHGERMDFVFGVDWIHKCFDDDGKFTRTDLNMPQSVPKRRSGPTAYIRDPPLTMLGLLQAQMTGKAMKEADVTFSRVFVSPALRSVQTATAVLEATQVEGKNSAKLCVEPGLYEWLGWVHEAHPDWLTPTELQAFGIPVDLEYQPYFPLEKLDFNEDVVGFYCRNGQVLSKVLAKYGHEGGNFLFVAHASSLDTCTKQLVDGTTRSHFEMNRVTQRVPYCAVVRCCQGPDKSWMLKNPPFPTLTHGSNIKFNAVHTFVTTPSNGEARKVENAAKDKRTFVPSDIGNASK